MDLYRKVFELDNQTNRELVASAIANDIVSANNLPSCPQMIDWLTAKIAEDTLFNILTNKQIVYTIKLAKKLSCEMSYLKTKKNVDDATIEKLYTPIFVFCTKIYSKFENLFNAADRENVEGDNLIIDDVMYHYEREKISHSYCVEIKIAPNPNYTESELKQRIIKRLHYERNKSDIVISFANFTRFEDNSFLTNIIITDVLKEDEFEDAIKFRLGRTSGKPWYRCKINSIDVLC